MWYINSIRVYAQELREDVAQIIPRLQPLGGGTILQTFGHEDDIRTLSCIVVGKDDKNDLKSLTQGGSATLLSPEGNLGTYEVKRVSVNRMPVICQTLRTDLPETAPVYAVEIELYG